MAYLEFSQEFRKQQVAGVISSEVNAGLRGRCDKHMFIIGPIMPGVDFKMLDLSPAKRTSAYGYSLERRSLQSLDGVLGRYHRIVILKSLRCDLLSRLVRQLIIRPLSVGHISDYQHLQNHKPDSLICYFSNFAARFS